jgi:hypothetical protein
MPMSTTAWFLPAVGGAERTFAEASCTLDTRCP